ncbi:hypothetical protein EWM64_g5235 [Hericium alpestre]|uniref:Essential protein Yae1 N-terminal domain-containing protein n=1 Tax=Hericium alpestre TaxID=135208 RepID=A0A4Y9ZVE4_9AGAM|nr:hypothetical protein EWM64_g5235 [Hericium alpestre]
MTTATSHVDADVQMDNPTPTLSPPACTCNMTPRFDPVTPRVDAGIQSDAPAQALAPTIRVHVGVQADAPAQPNSPHLDSYTPFVTGTHTYDTPANAHVPPLHTSNTPHTSAHARARTVQEIEPGLLTEILAKAIAKGEAAGLKKGKHVGFQDGMEAGWKSGTREGREEGYNDGKQTGITEGREQHRLEFDNIFMG